MYLNIFFIIIMLLLADVGPQIGIPASENQITTTLFWSFVGYCIVLLMIGAQNYYLYKSRKCSRNTLLAIANVELIAFFCLFYFLLGGSSLLNTASKLLKILPPLAAYFLGLLWFHVSSAWSRQQADYSTAMLEMRFLLPFIVPALLFNFVGDSWALLIHESGLQGSFESFFQTNAGQLFLFLGTCVLLITFLLFLPPLLVKLWNCRPLQKGLLRERLENLCRSADFQYGNILIWNVMGNASTAAIVGVLPRLRYILLTPGLLRRLPDSSIEAVVAHEIGHNYHRHLLFYPFILMGMVACVSVYSMLFSDSISNVLAHWIVPGGTLWYFVQPLSIFISFVLIITLYFRLVFGYFSRLFERQADLHVFKIGINPEHLTDALAALGRDSGQPLDSPNWHHYSIQQRIDFIKAAAIDPFLINIHHRKVHRMLLLYFVILAGVLVELWHYGK